MGHSFGGCFGSMNRQQDNNMQCVDSANKSDSSISAASCTSNIGERRVVFISLSGLYKTWYIVPPGLMYTALLVMPLKKRWIYNRNKYKKEWKIDNSSIFLDDENAKQFIQLLKWKDSQGLVLWINDYVDDVMDEVHTFWRALNEKLCNLSDPVTKQHYDPIPFDMEWWQNKIKLGAKYDVTTDQICHEFHVLTLKYDAMKEIIYQSNPMTLLPITYFPASQSRFIQINECEEENWFISTEYFDD